jgi:tetratricopeptide (TPR) repeat protein
MTPLRQRRALAAVRHLREQVRNGCGRLPELLLRMAAIYRHGGMLAEARRVLDCLLKADPLDLKALLAMTQVLLESGEAARAATLCRSLQKALPGMEEPYLEEIRCLSAPGVAGQPQVVIDALESYLNRFSERPAARLELANWYESAGRPGQAVEQYRRLLEWGYRPGSVYERLGALHYRAGDSEPALACFCEAERLQPGNPRVREARARLLYGLGRHAEAETAAAAWVEVAPRSLPARRLLARAALQAGSFEAAAVAYEAVVEAEPGSLQERREYAEALYFTGDLRDAAREYRAILSQDPKDGLAHFRLAEVLRQGSFFKEAEKHYGAALVLMPSSPLPLERLGDLATRVHQHRQAVGFYLRWMLLEPQNPVAHLRLGRGYRQLQEVAAARRHLERAEALGERGAELCHERAMLELLCSRHSLAREYLRRGLECRPGRRERALLEHELRELDRLELERQARAVEAEKAQKTVWKKLA